MSTFIKTHLPNKEPPKVSVHCVT